MKHVLLLALVTLPAYATDKPPAEPPKATATAEADANADANAAATGGNASANGVQTIESERQAPGVFVGAASPSAPCYYVNSWGGSVAGAGVARGKSRLDTDCVVRERARLLIEAGRSDLAVRLLYPDAPEATSRESESATPEPIVSAGASCAEHATRALRACNSK